MATRVAFSSPRTFLAADDRVQCLITGCGHYPRSDLPLFLAGYRELSRLDLNGGKVIEVCCGAGQLTVGMARVLTGAEIIGVDRYPDNGLAIHKARSEEGLSNVRFQCGDVLRLVDVPDASVDLIYGQAALHHLAHDTDALREEFSRVLKPNGRVVFVYEPLGHNPFWSMVRAYRIARAQMPDESNIVIPQLEHIAECFNSCQIQGFNLVGYPFKFLGRLTGRSVANLIHRTDAALMRRWPRLTPLAANANIIFTK